MKLIVKKDGRITGERKGIRVVREPMEYVREILRRIRIDRD